MVKKSIERLYRDRCNVTVRRSYKRENKSTGKREQILFQNIPCKLSFTNNAKDFPPVAASDAGFAVHQQVKLFISPELEIPEGSRITVTHEGREFDYRHSGVASVFPSHQEILLELFKGWA